MISDTAPLRCSPDELYQQFIDLHERHLEEKDHDGIYEIAQEFECFTNAHLNVLLNLKAKRPMTEEDANICKKLEIMLKEERNSWRLAKALYKDQLLTGIGDSSNDSDKMDDSLTQNGTHDDQMNVAAAKFSEEQVIGNFFVTNTEIRRMQVVVDWLEANEGNDLDYKDEEDKVEFYSEGPTAWENTFHAMRSHYNIDIPGLDITMNASIRTDLCDAMDPDAPIRTKKPLANSDKEVEIRLFKHMFKFLRAGRLVEGQELAQRVKYHWLSAMLDGWLPYSDPNLDEENLGTTAIHGPSDVRPVSGNKKRDIWKTTCFKAAKMHGLSSNEKAILGILGGNLKSVLPVCNTWSDQLWARLKCSIDVKIESALRDPNLLPPGNRLSTVDYPPEFYSYYQSLSDIFKSIKDLRIVSPFKEATIHQTVQKHLILNDIEGLLNQLSDWCKSLDYDNNLSDNTEAISPHFLRCFAHLVLFLRELDLVNADDQRGTRIIESYIALLTRRKLIASVAHYTVFLPRDNQIVSFAKLLATINDREERKHCLRIAKDSKLDVDEITQTVVELIRDESPERIDALDYLLYLDSRNNIAILHHGNIFLRNLALERKMEALKEAFLKLPPNLGESVEKQWRIHTNSDITINLKNNLRELDSFRALLETQEALLLWSEWNRQKPEEPKRPPNLLKFCDNVNYEQRLKQYQQDMEIWKNLREQRTDALMEKITQMFCFPGGWMKDLPGDQMVNGHTEPAETRLYELESIRRHFVPHMMTCIFNIFQLTNRHEDCLKLAHILADEQLKLYEEYTKAQVREFLTKISQVTKIIVKRLVAAG